MRKGEWGLGAKAHTLFFAFKLASASISLATTIWEPW